MIIHIWPWGRSTTNQVSMFDQAHELLSSFQVFDAEATGALVFDHERMVLKVAMGDYCLFVKNIIYIYTYIYIYTMDLHIQAVQCECGKANSSSTPNWG